MTFNPFAARYTPVRRIGGEMDPPQSGTAFKRSNNFPEPQVIVVPARPASTKDLLLDDFDKQLLMQPEPRRFSDLPDAMSSELIDNKKCYAQPSEAWVAGLGCSSNEPYIKTGVQQAFQVTPSAGSVSASSETGPFSSPIVPERRETQQFLPDRVDIARTRNAFHDRLRKVKEEDGQYSAGGNTSSRLSGKETHKKDRGPIVRGVELVPTTTLPDKHRSLFTFPIFNAVQSRCFSTAYHSDDNLVVSAPTGSGKTVIMELGILRLVDMLKSGRAKVVYQAPTKSLCSERYRDWQSKFAVFDLQCTELTGDTDHVYLKNVASASIIITTPEKWDSITRKWKDNAKLMNMIKLFLVDEVHILKDTRGATLEAIVSRMKTVGNSVRFVALSATIPNSEDVAIWLTRNEQARHLPAVREVFDDSFRPVQLKKHIMGHEGPYNPWAFDVALTEKIPDIVSRYSKGKPVMIFCPTKDSTQKTADKLAQAWQSAAHTGQARHKPRAVAKVENETLQKLLSVGVAFHHGSLSALDRQVVEKAFLSGDVSVICSTSTLAVGVNLPCYLVILKGTQGYADTGLQEYSSLEVMQMLGRAGRPQFETEACAVILCLKDRLIRYEKMVAGEEVLESSLHKNLTEHLNAEIGLGTINSTQSAKTWLASTFLNVRLQKNPQYYTLDPDHHLTADEALLQWCEKDLDLLREASLIENDSILRCTEYGNAMARYCVKFDTMRTFMAVPTKAKLSEILNVLCQAAEFRDFRLKAGEKAFYKELNKANETRYPIQVDLALFQHKVSLIIQAKLGCTPLGKDTKNKSNGGYLRQLVLDTNGVMNHAKRLIRCMIDILVQREDSGAVRSALELARGLGAGVWDDTVMQLKQIPGIGDVSTRKLAAAGIRNIDALFSTEPQRIEVILSKTPPFGLDLLKKVADFPMLHISTKECGQKRQPQKGVEVKLRCEVGFLNETAPLKFNRSQYSVLFMCDTSYGQLIDFRRFGPLRLKTSEEILLTALIEQPGARLRCHIMCDDIAGTHRFAETVIDCPSSWFPSKPTNFDVAFHRPEVGVKRSEWKASEEFFDEGLKDSDMLAAATTTRVEEIIEDIVDIDDIMPEQKTSRSSKKRKDSCIDYSNKEKEGLKVPQRLPNGNWTCQHTCKIEGKDCKHKCCRDGVKKKSSNKRQKKEKSDDGQGSDARNRNEKTGVGQQPVQRGALERLWRSEKSDKDTALSQLTGTEYAIEGLQPLNQSETQADKLTKSQAVRERTSYDSPVTHAISDVFDFGDYDWQAMDEIAASFERNTDVCIPVTKEIHRRSFGSRDEFADSTTVEDNAPSGMANRQSSEPHGPCLPHIVDSYSNLNGPDYFPNMKSHLPSPDSGSVHQSSDEISGFNSGRSGSGSDSMRGILARKTSIGDQLKTDSDTEFIEESEYERLQRLDEEEQKRKWTELGSELLTYETYGQYVRIVD